jgi:hypothetical protein
MNMGDHNSLRDFSKRLSQKLGFNVISGALIMEPSKQLLRANGKV